MTTLEKIRDEIEQTAKDYDKFDDYRRVRGLWIALDIIDKYAEQEPKIPCDLCGFNMDEVCEYLSVCPAIGKAVSK